MDVAYIATLALLGKQQRLKAVEELEQLKANIAEYGFLAPVMLDRHDHVIAGCEQLLAACAVGMDAVPVVYEHRLTEDERIYTRGILAAELKEASWGDLAGLYDEHLAAAEALAMGDPETTAKWLGAQDKLVTQVLRLGGELGLTPSARRALGVIARK